MGEVVCPLKAACLTRPVPPTGAEFLGGRPPSSPETILILGDMPGVSSSRGPLGSLGCVSVTKWVKVHLQSMQNNLISFQMVTPRGSS